MIRGFLAALALSASLGLASADGIYTKGSPVLQISAKSYDSVIAQSNHTSILEFYAPWCGHCQSLKPAYEKAAKNLAGLAKVAAINCDEESNKGFCGQMGVKGFPTLKIIKPGSKPGRPIVEDYNGGRTAKAIVSAVVDKIPNHIKKVQDADLDGWLGETTIPKAILFSDKGITGGLIKSLAVDFLSSIEFAQIRNKEKDAVKKYGVTKFPTLVLLPGGGKEAITYEGVMNRESILEFLSQVASPNLDPAPKKAKASSSKKATSTGSSASAFSEASKAHKSSDYEEYMQSASTVILNDDTPTESPLPIVENAEKPMVVKDVVPDLPQLIGATELEAACLGKKSGTCLLVLLPQGDTSTLPETASRALTSFAEVAEKHRKRQASIFPSYNIPAGNPAASKIRDLLKLKSDTDMEVIAINMKRKWWRSYTASSFDIFDVETFIDAIKLGEGSKQKLPSSFFSQKEDEPASVVSSAPEPEATPEPTDERVIPSGAEPEPVVEPSKIHNEL